MLPINQTALINQVLDTIIIGTIQNEAANNKKGSDLSNHIEIYRENFKKNKPTWTKAINKILITPHDTAGTPKIAEFEKGMNTPGLLFDRLTILNCKRFFYIADQEQVNTINKQINGIIESISQSKPAESILLAKEATQRVNERIISIAEPLADLQRANLLMWVNQDLLYTQDADKADIYRIRNYIKFFAVENSIRNIAIEKVDKFFIQQSLQTG